MIRLLALVLAEDAVIWPALNNKLSSNIIQKNFF
jgi:hypothetical protein